MHSLPIPNKESDLLGIIEALREEMIKIGMKEGLSSEKTIEMSQMLDHYIANYQTAHLLLD